MYFRMMASMIGQLHYLRRVKQQVSVAFATQLTTDNGYYPFSFGCVIHTFFDGILVSVNR